VLQLGYSAHLYSGNSAYVQAACNVGSHFIASNLFFFGFLMLWVRGHFWIAEVLLVVNFFNLSAAYFRHPKTPRFIHIPVVSGPLAFNFVALYWCGAAAVNAHSLPARILANIAIWGILAYGMFFLAAYKDYTMGLALSVLSAGMLPRLHILFNARTRASADKYIALGVAQFLTHIVAFQWIFAFIIMGILFVLSVTVGLRDRLGVQPFKPGAVVSEDQERQPLLREE